MATDPGVTQRKFDAEVAKFRALEKHFREYGIWMLKCEYPQILLAFATARSPQIFVPFGALINFEDYDARPLQVTLVHPCSERALKFNEVLPQVMQLGMAQVRGHFLRVRQDASQMHGFSVDQVLQGYEFDPEASPFLCIAGVRAYHDHPAHNGDSWWLHRGLGHGSLHQIINMLWSYGTKNVIQPHLQNQIAHIGYIMQPEVEKALPQ